MYFLPSLAFFSGLLAQDPVPPLVFVSRQIPPDGSVYWDVPAAMPGVGAHGRFRVAAPGKLMVRESDGALRVLVDGARPSAASLYLIDVNAPDVAYDGSRIVFAGLRYGQYDLGPVNNPGAWRIYTIAADGSNLRQVTFSDLDLDYSQFEQGALGFGPYDDTDPVWLPDGRIAFSSTRWPSYAQYSGVRTSNLYVVEADGGKLHRITAERNGADRPLVDPLTGKLVFSRWWRNHRFVANDLSTIPHPDGGYIQHLGLTMDRSYQYGGGDFLWRNAWRASTVNPDGTELALWSGAFTSDPDNHVYGGGFTSDGRLYANFFPMFNMTEASGFGGVRYYERGAFPYVPIAGITYLTQEYVSYDPISYGIYIGEYVGEPESLPDGRVVVSRAPDVFQDYGLYLMKADGRGMSPLYDNPGTTELRARVLGPRPLPPVLPDTVAGRASLLPPDADGPYDQDGSFTFDAQNVYFNGPVDMDIVSAPPIGSARTIRFFLDHQRTSPGSFPYLDWPILLEELPIAPDGSVLNPNAPANLPLFEQLHDGAQAVPFTGGPFPEGAAHVTGMNYGRPGTVASCVGCHAGHTMIPLPASRKRAQWTNLAPGASVTASSSSDPFGGRGLIDRRALKDEIWRGWTSTYGVDRGQWVQLTFPADIETRGVVLYNLRYGDEADSSVQVLAATVRLYADAAATQPVGAYATGPLSPGGTTVKLPRTRIRAVRVDVDAVTGTFYGFRLAGLAEIEVIGRGL